MKGLIAFLFAFAVGLPIGSQAFGDEFTRRAAQIADYKRWLDSLGSNGARYWTRLDSTRRPHKLYLGEGFYRADLQTQERFIDTFSHYLASHPDKFMLIDLYDETTKMPVGEFGWGGFRMFPTAVVSSAEIHQ